MKLCPYPYVIVRIGVVSLEYLVGVRYCVDIARVHAKLGHHTLAFQARDGKDWELVGLQRIAFAVEIPDSRVGVWRFVGRVVGFVKNEATDGVGGGSVEVGDGTVNAEPRGERNEVVVHGRELGAAGDIFGDVIILLNIARRNTDNVGHIEQALNDAVQSLRIRCR